MYTYIWWFPKIGIPPVIIHFSGIFAYKPIILGYPHGYGNCHIGADGLLLAVPIFIG